jgi:hypothetical protein
MPCVAWCLSQAFLNELKCAFIPPPRLKVIGDRFREIDDDAEYGPIDCRTDRDRRHGPFLSVNRSSDDTATLQSGPYEVRKPNR